MGLFTKKTKIKDPLAAEKAQAGKYLAGLLEEGTPDIPTREVTGQTDTQRRIQAGVGEQYADVERSYDIGWDYLTDIIGGQYDPRTSDYYKGLRQEAADIKGEAMTDIRQSSELGGMLQSTPRMAVESETGRKIDRDLLTQLGGMYETERGRMGQAVEGLSRLDASRAAVTGNLQAIADLERQIEQERNNAVYTQAMETVMFPYQNMINVANSIFGGSQPIVTGGGLTDLGFAASTAAGAAGSYFGGK